MRGLRGVGISGLAHPVFSASCLGGILPWNFDPLLASMTASMAKRIRSVFAAAPIVQGLKDGTGTPDVLSLANGTIVAGSYFYSNFDANQGSLSIFWTPEYSSGGIATNYHYLFYASSTYYFAYDYTNSWYYLKIGNQALTVASALTAGTMVNLMFSWDVKNTLDGTNYARVSINDTHTFGITTAPTVAAPAATMYVGSSGTAFGASGIIEGATLFRRVLYDGAYGVNVGNGDEVALIAAGVDPTTVTGSWDICFCLPTNASAGALTTGAGNAWSHPHSSNLLTRGFLSDRYYGGTNQWAVKFNGTSSYINCGSGATLDDLGAGGATFQVETWFLSNDSADRIVICKQNSTENVGWRMAVYYSSGAIRFTILGAATDYAWSGKVGDGKWHHVVGHYNGTTKAVNISVDGVWGVGSVGTGTYQSDAASNLVFGARTDFIVRFLSGSIGWTRIHNHEHYAVGTNFVPPRTFPGTDAGTVEAWALNEGTGTTATASVTTPGNNGTISNGTWEQQWLDEGSPVVLQSVIGSTNYNANVGSDAAIDDMADNAFTADGWFRVPKTGAVQYLTGKGTFGTNGWAMQVTAAGLLSAKVECATTDATVASTARWDDNLWHYFKMTFDDAGDRKVYIYVDNVDVSSGAVAGIGAIVSDAAQNGYIGYTSTSLTGAHSWVRWSNSVRGAGMIERSNPPAVDGNTLGQWNCTEGAGAVLDNAETTATRDGAITGTYSWNNSPAMESDSPGARQYAWGYVLGSDAANEGTKQVYAVTAGNDYSLSASAYSEDGVARPEIVIYDETGAAAIATVLGTTTSTEKVPDSFHITFEAPAGCSSISVKLLNATATGVVGWQQVQFRANLWDDPSFETGTAVTDIGTPTTSAQSADQAHTGTNSWKLVADAADEGFKRTHVVTSGKFYTIRSWVWAVGAGTTVDMEFSGASIQDGNTVRKTTSAVGAWQSLSCVVRATAASMDVKFTSNAAQTFYVDDVMISLNDDVTLTCTPASAANSVESSGIRVDGYDSAPQTIPANSIFANQGWIKFAWIPRHSAADVAKFGNATPAIAQIYGDADDYITLDWSAANTVRLSYNANGAGVQTGTWNATGAIVAGTTYQVEIKYTGSGMELIVGGTSRITITAAVAFWTVPTAIYPGSLQAGGSQIDAVFLAPT